MSELDWFTAWGLQRFLDFGFRVQVRRGSWMSDWVVGARES